MKYQNGEAVQLGDKVNLGRDKIGVVVGIIEDRLYANGYKGADWQYLNHGLLVSTGFGDLRMNAPDEDMQLVERQIASRHAG